MTPERHRRIGRLYHDALELDPQERAGFLDEACGVDEALRKEVESLIASHEQAEGFIEAPALDVAAELLAEDLGKEVLAASTPFPVDPPAGKPLFFWIVLLFGTVVLGLYVFAGVMIIRYGNFTKDFGWKYASSSQGVDIGDVDPRGPAAEKLQPGDRILAINNETRISRVAPSYLLRQIPAGSVYTIRVQRGGNDYEFELVLPPLTKDSRYFGPALSRLAVSVVFYVLAILIGLLRPGERVVQLACIGSLAGAVLELETVLRPRSNQFQGAEIATYWFLIVPFTICGPLIMYHFFYRFPPGAPGGRLWSFLKRFFYWWAATLCVMTLSMKLAYFTDSQVLIATLFSPHLYLKVLPAVGSPFYLFITIAICAVIVRKYRLIKEPDQHRRMKWVIYGSVAGLVPLLINTITGFTLDASGQIGGTQGHTPLSTGLRTLDLIADLAVGIIPITFGYAIIKHKVFDINVVVRRGLQYVLAKNGLRVILALPLVGLGYQIISNPDQTVSDILFHNPLYLFSAAAAAVCLKYRRRLTEWIDRKFFRETYNQEQILIGLMDEIKELNSMAGISELVSRKLDSALHLTRIFVFYRGADTRDLALGYSSGGSRQGLTISTESQLFRFMEGRQSAEPYPFPQRQVLPPGEQAWLDRLGINLIVPMSGTDGRLIGLLLLGEKKSEQPYTANDRRLLAAIAQQIAVVYEIVLLKLHVDKEARIKREVLAHLEEQQINLVKECPACGACYDSAAQVCAADGGEVILALPVERTIDGKYRLDQLLGKGGAGAVYRATDLRLARQVAIKIIMGNLFGDQAALRRFEREARATAKLNHPNIVAIHDYGRTAGDGAYLVMELVPGVTLRAELRQALHLPAQVAADWFHQLLEGVKAAHEAGIIHRDLKPENVLIARLEHRRTLIKIVDFGLAKLRLPDMAELNSLTAPGLVMGTISYMSPEQFSGEEVDERSDIFSLGVMVVEALTGSRPFSGRTYTEILTSILHKSYHLTGSEKATAVLDQVLQKCLAKDRKQRYASVAELQRELIPAIEAYLRFAASEVSI
jgi:serine/threonine-protein kinase